MQEIKFRAYDTLNKCMVDYDYITFYAFGGSEIGGTSCISGGGVNIQNHQWKNDIKQQGIVLMQYTGLKDKNGKEIYEGDICQYKNRNIVKIYFKDGHFLMNNWGDISCDLSDVEVIGNIYENSELLKGGDNL